MPTDEDKLQDGFDTTPPPEGEDDPYGAPTRVARVPDKLLDELMKARGEPAPPEPARPEPAPPEPARPEPAPPEPARPDAGSNDLSALAAAASHVVVPPRPRGAPAKPAAPAVAKPLAPQSAPRAYPAAPPPPVAAPPAPPAPPPPSAIDPVLPAQTKTSELEPHVPFGLDDPSFTEAPSSPGGAPLGASMQSGRTVPLSAALLASVVKSVEDKRAVAATDTAAAGAPVELPAPKRRSVLVLALILAIGLGVFITGVVMFLDALR